MIPIVDLTRYSLSVSEGDAPTHTLKKLADEICSAMKNVGFVYIINHGIPEEMVTEIFALSKTFFNKPVEVKRNFARPVDDSNGWIDLEKEKLNPDRPFCDLREAYNMRPTRNSTMPEDIFPEFTKSFKDFFMICENLTWRLLDLLAIGLDIDRDYLRQCHQKMGKEQNNTTLRANYYPPIRATDVKEGQARSGEHSDYGSITLLFQDDIGRLEIKAQNGDYMPVKPIEGAIVMNLGDMMERWTADSLKATKHRVLLPVDENVQKRSRQSFAFFVQPDDDVMITCLDKSNRYPPISSLDYLKQKFATIYK
ncbi:uncharacterized protein LOC125648251 [Ostrea edulis]|uniref:uncharacterized protein LOC125648251 n=1 Tax=Ostrea edulis TaxID=37623 RepID=UPI0024AF13F8|nr:uncharacterized protein LOC125648251 [Ostrea edulis]